MKETTFKRQKRMALINDLTGFGRCSLAVMLPIVSAMKVQACPVPTALLSVHTGFSSHYIYDCTHLMMPYIDNWEENGLEFDGICTGFFGSAEQIDIAGEFIKRFRRDNTLVIIDPVMGDHGRLYSSYTKEMCREMRKLVSLADVLTPNLTEVCELLDIPYPKGGAAGDAALYEMAQRLAHEGAAKIVITGMETAGRINNFVFEGRQCDSVSSPKIGGERSGTGDAFAAVVAADLINGATLKSAVKKAAAFVNKTVAYAEELNLPWNYGLPIEEYLTELR